MAHTDGKIQFFPYLNINLEFGHAKKGPAAVALSIESASVGSHKIGAGGIAFPCEEMVDLIGEGY